MRIHSRRNPNYPLNNRRCCSINYTKLNHQKPRKRNSCKIKKPYNTLSNAYNLASIQYGNPESWSDYAWDTSETGDPGRINPSSNIMDKLQPFLNITRRCDGTKGCYPSGVKYRELGGAEDANVTDDITNISKVILSDGMLFQVWPYLGNCTNNFGTSEALKRTCAGIVVDTNGFRGPNQNGKDTFVFWLTNKGIIPTGTPEDKQYRLSSECRDSSGSGCTAWVILKENLNYPPYGLGWN